MITWGFSETGVQRWSAMNIPDPFDILGQAREFGMNYGIIVSCGLMKSRTIASGCRSDREFTADEMSAYSKLIKHLHDITQPPQALTDAQIEASRCIAEGDRNAAAARLNISESALKVRLSSALTSLMARTTAEAIQRARDYRLL